MDFRVRSGLRWLRRVGSAVLRHPLLNRVLLVVYVVAGIFILLAAGRMSRLIGDELWTLIQAPLGIGAGNTLVYSVSVIVGGVLIGFALGWARVSSHPIVSWPAAVYIDLIRGVPPLILVIFAYFLVPSLLGIRSPTAGLTFAVLALGMHSAAYQAEIFRAGFQSIPRTQIEAAESLGLTRWQSMRHVILPQTVRVTLPALGNEFATVVKDTSILAAISAEELTYWGRNNAMYTVAHLDWVLGIWIVIAILYFAVTYVITHAVGAIEQSYRVPGLTAVSV